MTGKITRKTGLTGVGQDGIYKYLAEADARALDASAGGSRPASKPKAGGKAR